jgi:hypothetical protein
VRKPLKIVLAIVLVAIAGAIAWQILRTREPSYQGRSLGSWLTAYYPVTQKTPATERARKAEEMRKAHEAVRQIGTDALPTLLRMQRPDIHITPHAPASLRRCHGERDKGACLNEQPAVWVVIGPLLVIALVAL